MALQTPTLEDILNSFIREVEASIPELSTSPGSVARQTLINPAAAQISFLFDFAKRISTLQNVFEATGTDLDALASTYGLSRRSGTTALGILYVDLTQLTNIQKITINAGTIVRSSLQGASNLSYVIPSNYTFSSTDRAVFEATAASVRDTLDSLGLNSIRLAATVSIQAVNSGTQGNTGAFTLNNTLISNVPNVINLSPVSGGTDTESDESLRQRLISIFTGNSVGTAASLLSAALTPPTITGGFLVRAGDPLMTRDGSTYDDQGNLITPGTGRAVDIYVQGTSISTTTNNLEFSIKDPNNFVSFSNSLLVGQPASGQTVGRLPVISVSSIFGTESGASFSQGVPTVDDEGNVLIEGNFALIKDVEASKYKIVQNLTTGERKLAYSLSPTNTTYSTVETITTSELANSPQSQDRILFLKNKVGVTDELVSRGLYNGADQLAFNNVASANKVYEEKRILETIKIEQFEEVSGGIAISLKHKPVISINSVVNTRLGTSVDVQIIDNSTSQIKLIGRFPPRAGDYVIVDYIWQNQFYENLNFTLTGDLLKWGTASNNERDSATLLAEQELQAQNIVATQPFDASYVEVVMSGIPDREVVELTLTGTTTEIVEQQSAVKTSQQYTYSLVGINNIARLLRVSNLTKGFNYNLADYHLKSNKFDRSARVNTQLLPQQFQLNAKANNTLLQSGDKIILGIPAQTLAWSSQEEFENNVGNNLSPIFDPTKLAFTAGGLVLKNRAVDNTITPTSISGFITQDTTLSGVVEVTGDLIIQEGVVVDVEPNTIVKIQSADQLTSTLEFAQKIIFDNTLTQDLTIGVKDAYTNLYTLPLLTQYSEFYYVYFKPLNFNSSYFTIINQDGDTVSIKFDQEILTKTINNSQVVFYIAGREVPQSFNQDIEATLDLLNTTTSIKATLLGAKDGSEGAPRFTAAPVATTEKYYVLIDRTPIITNSIQNDFSLSVDGYSDTTFQRFSYNSHLNALLVDYNILAIDAYADQTSATPYIVRYYVEKNNRISIVVEGTLRILGTTPQSSVLFTSTSDSASPGDWEGIIFTQKSHTRNPRTEFQSQLLNARVLYANNGITLNGSDAVVENCIIKDSLNSGIVVNSTNISSPLYSGTNFNLLELDNLFAYFKSENRIGFTSADNIQVARYSIPDNLVTALGRLPNQKLKLSSTRYIVDLKHGIDFNVFIDSQKVTEIDTSVPFDGYVDFSLQPDLDFVIEYDINLGYSLVFLYTAGSSKLKNVYNLIISLKNALRTGTIQLTYYTSIVNNAIYDNLVVNASQGIVLDSLATTSINRNTIHNTNTGIVINNSIAIVRNNLISDYKTCPLAIDNQSLIKVHRNNFYSKSITQNEQISIEDTDLLIQNVTTSSLTFVVRSPAKYNIGSIIDINQEQMIVQAVNSDSIVVLRGQNKTIPSSHPSGSIVTIYQSNIIFNVTGILGDFCELVETDQYGVQLPTTLPIQMRLVAPNSFRVAIPVNKRVNFYYKYRFRTRNSNFIKTSETKVLPKIQFGIGAIDVINIIHELPLHSQDYTLNNENYSADPLFYSPNSFDFSFSPLYSYSSRQNPAYGSLVIPKNLHRYIGFLDVGIVKLLDSGLTRIPVPYEPLIINNYDEVQIVGNDSLTENTVLKVKEFSYSITADEADQGAVGVFILDELSHPDGIAISGSYQINYAQPIDLGTSIPPYYLETTINYVVDVKNSVTFDTIQFTKDAVGGEALFTVQVVDSISQLSSSSSSPQSGINPIIIEEIANTNKGQLIQINITLKGNDGSFGNGSSYLYPVVQDFQLNYLPAKDSNEYKVLSLIKNTVLNQTNILIDKPISNTTYGVVGSSDQLELYVRTRASNYSVDSEFILTTTEAVTSGDTFIKAQGDLTTIKPDASPGDVIKVNYLGYNSDVQEQIYFTQDGSQVSQNMYASIDLISSLITRDRQVVLPSTETIAINEINQPTSGVIYKASYEFEGPLEGEILNITHNYNQAIISSTDYVESKKSIFTDVLVKQVTNIPVRIAVSITLEPTSTAVLVQAQVSAAFANLFNTTLADIQTARTLNASDLIRATGDIEGIDNIVITTLSRNLITGEIQDPIEFIRRESATLEENSPRITII